MAKLIKIFDTTLRDGEQSPGCSMNIVEKIKLAKQLDMLGVDVIEAGFAIASPGDFAAVKSIAETVENATVASLSRALKSDIDVAYDAVKLAKKPRIHVFLATSDLHMEYKLKMSREEVICAVKETVSYARSLCDDIEFSAEDASRSDMEFLAQVIAVAIDAGATTVNIPDTVGYSTPEDFGDLIAYLKNNVANIDKATISVHCHNDLGLATANSLAAIKNGATQVECTINGIGERAGNAALEEVVMNLHTRKEFYDAYTNIDTTKIFKTSQMLSKIIGVNVQPNKAIVGANAFAHEAGIHQHGVLANKQTYEIMSPEFIGINQSNMVIGKHSGKHALNEKLKEMGFILAEKDLAEVFAEFKILADRQKSVEDCDLEALVQKKVSYYEVPQEYKLQYFVVNVGNNISSTCNIKLIDSKANTLESVEASKFGPIDASYKAINNIVKGDFKLADFIINSITEGKDAQGSVTVKISSENKIYNGHGVSLDIIEAAIKAYISAINNMMYDKKLSN